MKGQSLIEVLVALSIAVVVLAGMTIAVVSSLRNAQFTKNQNLATQYARQGMEIVRQIRDANSTLDSFNNIKYCLPEDSKTLILEGADCGGPNIKNTFVREVKIDPKDPNPLSVCANNFKVTVLVSWLDSSCSGSTFCHQIKLVSCFGDKTNAALKP